MDALRRKYKKPAWRTSAGPPPQQGDSIAGETPAALAKQQEKRRRAGICEECGKVKTHGRFVALSVPLTIPNQVYKGVCLECRPHPESHLRQNELNFRPLPSSMHEQNILTALPQLVNSAGPDNRSTISEISLCPSITAHSGSGEHLSNENNEVGLHPDSQDCHGEVLHRTHQNADDGVIADGDAEGIEIGGNNSLRSERTEEAEQANQPGVWEGYFNRKIEESGGFPKDLPCFAGVMTHDGIMPGVSEIDIMSMVSNISLDIEIMTHGSRDATARGSCSGSSHGRNRKTNGSHKCNSLENMSGSNAWSLTSSSHDQILSDQREQELKNRLQGMGFSKKSIKIQKQIYRRHSHSLKVDDFICTLLEMEDEGYHLPAEGESAEHDVQQDNSSDLLSDERVRQLEGSLQCLGFDSETINRHKEVYRRHSKGLKAEEFIAVVLDDMEEKGSCPPLDNVSKDHEARPEDPVCCDDDLFLSILDMGFGEEQVKTAIRWMRHKGAKLDVDSVLGVLLGGSHPWESAKSHEYCADDPRSHMPLISKNSAPDDPNKGEPIKLPPSIEIAPGQRAWLLNGKQTLNALNNGTAVSAPCVVCNSILQCCMEADYVLCPDCDVTSPIGGMLRRGLSSRTILKGANTSASTRSKSMGIYVGSVGLGHKREQNH